MNRGQIWANKLAQDNTFINEYSNSIKVVDTTVAEQPIRYISVVPDSNNPFVRAKNGEVGLLEGWNIAKAVNDIIVNDANNTTKTTIVAIIDVPSQAYGRREEAYGIHQSLAAAANAYAKARLAGHCVIGLIVGKAMSGGFLAHGYQANRLISLDDAGCMVHAMGKESAARVTLRTVAELEKLASTIPPMAYDIDNYDKLGLLWKKVSVSNADEPSQSDVTLIEQTISAAIVDIQKNESCDLSQRLNGTLRIASKNVRLAMAAEW